MEHHSDKPDSQGPPTVSIILDPNGGDFKFGKDALERQTKHQLDKEAKVHVESRPGQVSAVGSLALKGRKWAAKAYGKITAARGKKPDYEAGVDFTLGGDK